MILTVTVNPALDKNYDVPGFALQGIHRVHSMSTVPAGKGLNVSRVLHNLGVATIATGFVGGFTGRQIEDGLDHLQVEHNFVRIRAESRSNCLIVDHNQDVHCEIKEPGPSIPRNAWKRLEKKIVELAPKCSWVVFAGSPPPDTQASIYVPLIRSVQALGIKVALDTRAPWLKEGIKAKPDLIKPNWEEFQELVGPCYSTVQGLGKARELVEQGLGTVVVSMGAKGAFAVNREGSYLVQELPPIKVISPIGSGDALVAGLLSKLEDDAPFDNAFRFGLAVACSNAAHFGAGIFDPVQVKSLEQEVTVDQVLK
ncbi:MAG TPA: 1-phosphofructokinase family hexose kinase [Firmicutes bacterium]|jgi:tagatose 6-phosphate kinase|nr:1-phosphofructokinase family hexose kinase [Bacillota bacterium]